MDKELLAVAGGSKPADVVISNGRIVNVYTGEIYDGGVAISVPSRNSRILTASLRQK